MISEQRRTPLSLEDPSRTPCGPLSLSIKTNQDSIKTVSGPKLAQQLSPNANMKRGGPGDGGGGGYNRDPIQ